jgi:drug/metabolite transporter (DMT)-like permease
MIAAAATLAGASLFLRLARPPLAIAAVELRAFSLDRGFLVAIGYMTLFATIGTFTVQNWAQARLSATRAAVIFALEPVWAAIFAAIVLGERLGVKGYAGGALVIAGILVSEVAGADDASNAYGRVEPPAAATYAPVRVAAGRALASRLVCASPRLWVVGLLGVRLGS